MPLRRNRIPAIRRAIPQAAARGVYRAAGFVADLARQLAPIDEGDLRASLRVEPAAPALRVVVKAGGVRGPNKFVDYAPFVEFGTSRSPAQPFLTPAARRIDVRREVATELRRLR